MTFKQTKAITLMLITFFGAITGWASVTGRPEIVAVAFTIALLVKYLSNKHLKPQEITADELVIKITEKSARVSFAVFGISASLIGAVLLAIDHGVKGPLYFIGFTLSLAVMTLFLLNLFFSFYYRRKYYDQK